MFQSIRARLPMLLLAGGLSALSAVSPAVPSEVVDEKFPPQGRLSYSVLRHGKEIGTQTIEFRRDGDRLTVRHKAHVAVDLLFLTLYRFEHEAEERWVDGRLVSLTSRTNDDGKKRAVELRRDGDRLRGVYNGKARDMSADLLPASFWHPDTVRQSRLLDPIKGRPRTITVTDKGEEPISVSGETVRARHYVVEGQVERELWYGPDGRLLQMQFAAEDGSRITVILRVSTLVGENGATDPLSSGGSNLI